jgi:hypothetical protein
VFSQLVIALQMLDDASDGLFFIGELLLLPLTQ